MAPERYVPTSIECLERWVKSGGYSEMQITENRCFLGSLVPNINPVSAFCEDNCINMKLYINCNGSLLEKCIVITNDNLCNYTFDYL